MNVLHVLQFSNTRPSHPFAIAFLHKTEFESPSLFTKFTAIDTSVVPVVTVMDSIPIKGTLCKRSLVTFTPNVIHPDWSTSHLEFKTRTHYCSDIKRNRTFRNSCIFSHNYNVECFSTAILFETSEFIYLCKEKG